MNAGSNTAARQKPMNGLGDETIILVLSLVSPTILSTTQGQPDGLETRPTYLEAAGVACEGLDLLVAVKAATDVLGDEFQELLLKLGLDHIIGMTQK
jgi:hypothetical protein